MKFISTAEASLKWKISQRRVVRLASEGRIEGAIQVSNSWMIPDVAKKPADGRTKKSKEEIKENYFRFPLFVNCPECDFTPPLSEDEKMLRHAQIEYLACNFRNAENELKKLSVTSESIYVRQMSLFLLCLISVVSDDGNEFDFYYGNLELALMDDFPNKKEMELLLPWLFICLTLYKNAAEAFCVDKIYEYSPSVYPLMTYLSLINKDSVEKYEPCINGTDIYEIETRQLESSGCFLEAQLLHLALFLIYYLKADEKPMEFHLKKAMDIAYNHGFLYFVADYSPYYKPCFDKVLADYPKEFCDKIKHSGLSIDNSFSEFTKKHNITDLFSSVSNGDIKYILCAMRGYTYKRVANIMHVSEHTVSAKYSAIFEKMYVSGRSELSRLLSDTWGRSFDFISECDSKKNKN